MPRSIDQILAEVNSRTDPQRQTILRQVADIPNQMQAEEASLGAKKTEAFDEILGGARRRGLGFSGIPIGEQARYASTEYAPAVARMKTSFNDRRGTLESALAGLDQSNYSTAQGIFNQDRAFEEQQRQFNEQMAYNREQSRRAAAAASAQPSWMNYLMGGNQGKANNTTTVDPEEAAYQAYLNQQSAQARQRASLVSRLNNSGLRVLNSSPGLAVRGGGTIPSQTQFTGNIRLPGF
jgi:hypothetical protein